MKSVVLFASLGMGMAATLLMGFLAGSIVTIIVYLAGSNILLSHELKKARAAQWVPSALDPENADDMHSSSATDRISRKKSHAGQARPRHSHQDQGHPGTTGTARGHTRDAAGR